MSTFDNAFVHVIGVEGGYVNDPRDTGGETNYGITKNTALLPHAANLSAFSVSPLK